MIIGMLAWLIVPGALWITAVMAYRRYSVNG